MMKNLENLTTPEIETEIASVEKSVLKLQAEQQTLPNDLREAFDDSNSATLVRLRRRADEIPIELQVEQLRLRRFELQTPELEASATELLEPLTVLKQNLDRARLEYEAALNLHRNALETVKNHKIDLAEQRRALENLRREFLPNQNAPSAFGAGA